MIRHAYQSITIEVDHVKNEHIKNIYILHLASATLLRFLFTLVCCGNKAGYQYKCSAVQHGGYLYEQKKQILSGTKVCLVYK